MHSFSSSTTLSFLLSSLVVVITNGQLTETVTPSSTPSPTLTPTADPSPVAPLPTPPLGPLPPLGAMAIALTAIAATVAIALFAYYKGRRDERAAAAVPISERDANSRRVLMAAIEVAHGKYMKEIAVMNVVHMNPVSASASASGGPSSIQGAKAASAGV